jgi:hypothetical protein
MEKPTSYFDWELQYQHDPQKGMRNEILALVEKYVDKATLNRSAALSDSQIHLKRLSSEEGLLICEIAGDKNGNKALRIRIDPEARTVTHRCEEFQQVNLYTKKFCSHLAKLCLFLKEEHPRELLSFLKDISQQDYAFRSFPT